MSGGLSWSRLEVSVQKGDFKSQTWLVTKSKQQTFQVQLQCRHVVWKFLRVLRCSSSNDETCSLSPRSYSLANYRNWVYFQNPTFCQAARTICVVGCGDLTTFDLAPLQKWKLNSLTWRLPQRTPKLPNSAHRSGSERLYLISWFRFDRILVVFGTLSLRPPRSPATWSSQCSRLTRPFLSNPISCASTYCLYFLYISMRNNSVWFLCQQWRHVW